MRWRNLVLTGLLLLAVAAAVVGAVGALLKSDPAFYAGCAGCTDDDAARAAAVVTRFGDLKNDIRSKPEWGASFTADELNAFFRQALGDDNSLAAALPAGLHDPRVSLDGDTITLAARYGEGFWSTVLSVAFRVWLVKDETNTVCLELVAARAGGLPLGTQSLLQGLSEAARDSNVAVTWYRHAGNPVGVCRFYADQPNPTTQIARFQVADGKLTITGRTLADAPGKPTPVVGGEPE